MTEKIIVALDLGTSGCRAAAVSADGRVLFQKSAPLAPVRAGKGLSEYDAGKLLEAQFAALNAVLDEAGPQNAAAVAVASQRSTVVLWDKTTGRAVAPVLTWEDGRAVQEAELASVSQEEIHERTGLYKTPYFSAPKIAWCLKHCPLAQDALNRKTLAAAPVASYFIWHLTKGSVFAADPTLAQRTLLFDLSAQTWSEPLCNAFGVPLSVLPEIFPSGADYGFYEYKGISIPVRACAGDQQAAAYASGLEKGAGLINYGTGAFFLYNAGTEKKRLPGMLSSLSVSLPGAQSDTLFEGPVNAAGSVFLWLKSLGVSFDMAEADALCQASQKPVLLLPALGGLGAPYWDYSVSPVLADLSPQTQKADIVAGAVRGVAFSVADVAYYLQTHGFEARRVGVCGGLARMESLVQFQADILQRELFVLEETERTVLGAARLAAEASGWKTASWPETAAFTVAPSLFGVEADREYRKWRAFVEWCRSRPA